MLSTAFLGHFCGYWDFLDCVPIGLLGQFARVPFEELPPVENPSIIKKLIENPAAISRKKSPPSEPVRKPRQAVERTSVALQDRSVSISNALARGAQGLNLSQKRIVALALAKTDSMNMADAAASVAGWQIRLTALEYAEAYDVDPDTAYVQLRTSAASLLRVLWTTVTPAAKGKGEVITQGQWLTLAEYRKREGTVDIVFHPRVAPHLLALRSHFVTYKLKQAAALRSIYAWRLFECLQSWRSKGTWRVSVEDFIRAMDAPKSCTENFKDLRRRVIEPAVKELSEKDNLLIEWVPEKAGKKVAYLTFKFCIDPQGRLEI